MQAELLESCILSRESCRNVPANLQKHIGSLGRGRIKAIACREATGYGVEGGLSRSYRFIVLKRLSGIARTAAMMYRHSPGT